MVIGWGIIGWIVLGGIAGWIASKIMRTDAQMGLGANIVVGILGGLLGGFILGGLVGMDVAGGGLIFSMLTAILGAVILLWIVRLITRRR